MLRSRARVLLLVVSFWWTAACQEEASRAPVAGRVAMEQQALVHVGEEVCASCHAEEAGRWRGSHHDLAMEPADDSTVLGNFDGAELEHRGERFHFYRRNGRFFLRTAGGDGEPDEFEVTHTFGVEPLQQYLVPLPGGRLQALAAAWDTRPLSQGGQRWFHLHPEDPVPPGDVLHWTGEAGSWNAMCAECHSTDVSKGYRPSDDTYETTWSEVDVSCEACHGPGSRHVAWARRGDSHDANSGLSVGLRNEARWVFASGSPTAHRVPPRASRAELETCAPCHSRRSRIGVPEPGERFLDVYRPAVLEEGFHHADVQILDDVYVWGSFVQSRMHAAGVTCSDCHDPHRLRIEEPDAACARCHRSETFATASHHHHTPDSEGASCVACHMPAKTYMVVDTRRDHSFRVPRPDLSAAIGVPNACSDCHPDRPASWAAAATSRWYGSERAGEPHYGEILDAGRRRARGAARGLATLSQDAAVPGIVRASALQLLAGQLEPSLLESVRAGLGDRDVLVRMAAVLSAEALPPEQRVVALEPLLGDPRRAVRIDAARALAPARRQVANPRALDEALAEYRTAQSINADRPESHVNLGILHTQLGALDLARREYEAAIRVGPFFVPAYVNLADLQHMQQREDQGERVLRQGLERVPDAAALHHALGLLLVRQQRSDDAVSALSRAAELAPEAPRYAYVHGIALHSAVRAREALTVLKHAHQTHPPARDILVALMTLHRDAGELDSALLNAKRLVELRPEDGAARAFVRELEAGGL